MTPCSPLSLAERTQIADRILAPFGAHPSLDELERKFPQRQLPQGALVTRVAPSPTGSAHIGLVYMSLVNRLLAHQSKGVFILRIEDTDSDREVAGAFETIVNTLRIFGLSPDEGIIEGSKEKFQELGNYGHYLQSLRSPIYRAVVRDLMLRGLAYPCFCTPEELQGIAETQRLTRIRTGYYGSWAKWRDAAAADVMSALDKGLRPVIRLRSWGDYEKRTSWKDGVKGTLALPENDLDAVILKSDGQSLYHLAHLVDDHFMRVTSVVRGDEWVPSVPLHLQIYSAMGWSPPTFAHLSTIQTTELVTETDPETGEQVERRTKRKLSKRKDPEASVEFYLKSGFPPQAVLEYLLNIANSTFEEWRRKNRTNDLFEFGFRTDKCNPAGALADTAKLTDISRDVISRMSVDHLVRDAMAWLKIYDADLYALAARDMAYTSRCLGIERGGTKPSKRIPTWGALRRELSWCFDEIFSKIEQFDFDEKVSQTDRAAIITTFLRSLTMTDDKTTWYNRCKEVATQLGFAAGVKEYEQTPANYKGHIGDVTMVLRVALCGSRQSPDLYEVIQILGEKEVRRRLGVWAA